LASTTTGSAAKALAASSPTASRTSTSQRGIPLIAEAMSDRGRCDGVRVARGAGVGAVAVGEVRASSCAADDGVPAAPLAGPVTGRVPELGAAAAVAVTGVPVAPPDEGELAVGLADGATLLPALVGEAVLDAGAAAEPVAVGVAPPVDAVEPLEEPVLEEPVLEEPVLEEPVLEEPVLEELEEPVLEEPEPEELEEPVPEEPVLAAGAAAVAGADVWAAAVGAVVAASEAVDVTPVAGWVTELTMDPSVLVTGSVTEFTTPETVAVTPESSDGWPLVAAWACAVGTARRNAVPPVAIANPAARRTVRRVFGLDIDNSSHRETRA
jgi:hypothetical protein